MSFSHRALTMAFTVLCAAVVVCMVIIAGVRKVSNQVQQVKTVVSATKEVDHGFSTTTLTVISAPVIAPPKDVAIVAPTSSIQYVLLAFDGSRSPDMWRKTLDFANQMKAANAPVHFTYFISGVYLIPQANRMAYLSPGHPAGTSAIGWGWNAVEIGQRIGFMNEAIANGHEIASHANGHFDGSKWTEAQWDSELTQFATFAGHPNQQVDLSSLPSNQQSIRFPQGAAIGFRAPELGQNDAMMRVLKSLNYLYDASRPRKATDLAYKTKEGIWEIGLSKIPYANTSSTILSMDYNFYFKQSGAKDTALKGSPEWQKMYDDMLTSYRNYFAMNYSGNRAPISIGHHFSEWNDGVYWEVMKAFAQEVCGKPDVRCVSHEEYARILDAQSK